MIEVAVSGVCMVINVVALVIILITTIQMIKRNNVSIKLLAQAEYIYKQAQEELDTAVKIRIQAIEDIRKKREKEHERI